MSKIGINGFGRIGRLLLRIAIDDCAFVVAINDPYIDINYMAYLFRYDSTYGRFEGTVQVEDDFLIVNEHRIRVFKEENPANIMWSNAEAEYIVEATGMFVTTDRASEHFKGGAKKVIITAPSDAPTFVVGVNLDAYRHQMKVVSAGSSTVNALAPLAKVLHDNFDIIEGFVTSLFVLTTAQRTVDAGAGKMWRDGRGACQNVIPLITGAAKTINRVLPQLSDRIDGVAFRVPIPSVSLIDFSVQLGKVAPFKTILEKLEEASKGPLEGIISVTHDEVVSSDFRGNPHSAIIDMNACLNLSGKFIKIVAWFDNEYSYARRVLDLVRYMQIKD